MNNKPWFLFIEGSLITVTAMIGVLAAALFPSMTGYLERSRDAARMSHIKDISTAIGAYYADNEKYPSEETSGCIPTILETSRYILSIPTDPTPWNISTWCDGTDGMTYAYRVLTQSGLTVSFALAVSLENSGGGNSKYSLPAMITLYKTPEKIEQQLIKGSWKYYILVR
jgi:type II secretory pathway pseudopilin PulG